jgi:iron complex transport system substrate-binding protein
MVGLVSRLRWLLPLAATLALALAAPAGALAATDSGFPVTIKAANGKVTIPSRPTRIVSLSPAATQDLFADGAGKQVVAVDSYSTYPKGAPVTSLNGYSPNVEAIAKYRPDLVVVYVDNDDIVGHLETLHIPVLLEPAVANLNGAYEQIEQLGQATGHASAAAQVAASMKRKVSAIVASVPRAKQPLSVYAEIGAPGDYTLTSDTFIGQILGLFGLRNIADRAGGSNPYPQLSAEYIVAANPSLIILADIDCCGQTRATVAARPGWKNISAVKTGAILAVPDSTASQWGPTIVTFIEDIADEVKKLEAEQAK